MKTCWRALQQRVKSDRLTDGGVKAAEVKDNPFSTVYKNSY